MCRMKSGIILKDRVFVPPYDSHTKMLEELEIEDTKANAGRLFVRAELYPKDGDIRSDVNSWVFNVDQDIVPDWFVTEYEEERMIEAVEKWKSEKVRVYTPEELKEILRKHRLFLDSKDGGEKADLRGANLSGADLRGADLRGANLSWAKGVER